jgi:hypothetical protein
LCYAKNSVALIIIPMYKNKTQIIAWLHKNKINDYSLNDDLSVNIKQTATIHINSSTCLPVHFKDSYHFAIRLDNIETLKGVPKEVKGMFVLNMNSKLKNLKYLPKKIKEDLIIENFNNVDCLLDIKDTQFSFLEIYPLSSIPELKDYRLPDGIKYKECYCFSYVSFINNVIPLLEKRKLDNMLFENKANNKIKI